MLRKAISNQLNAHLEAIQGLEDKRRREYGGHRLTEGYKNLTNSIMHYEGRVEEARSILRMIDDLEVRVTASECDHCGHHEIGYQDSYTKFHALRPGQWILVRV